MASLTIDGNEQAYRAFLDAAATDENVVGVVLSGSRGAGIVRDSHVATSTCS